MNIRELIKSSDRGAILVVEYENGDRFFNAGDELFFDNDIWVVRGVEMSRNLMSPQNISNSIGLVIRKKYK